MADLTPDPKAHALVAADDEQQAPQHSREAHSSPAPEAEPTSPSIRSPARRKAGKRTYSRHGLTTLRKTITQLGTAKLDGRSRVAVAARRFKADLLADIGGNPSRAQETIAEMAARQWVLLCSLDDWIARQPSLVTKNEDSASGPCVERNHCHGPATAALGAGAGTASGTSNGPGDVLAGTVQGRQRHDVDPAGLFHGPPPGPFQHAQGRRQFC
jgi:hypothetical protein